MKKVLFFAAVLAVASMTFVACGKKENKEAEGEKTEQTAQPAQSEQISRAEACTRAIEAASSLEEMYGIVSEYSDLSEDDFTSSQQARIEKAAARFGEHF